MLALIAGVAAVAVACSNASEGERCEVNNNNDDCTSGLRCVPAAEVNQPYNTADRCCPENRANASHPACTLGPSIGTSATTDASAAATATQPDDASTSAEQDSAAPTSDAASDSGT
jgi:hypothetical protein